VVTGRTLGASELLGRVTGALGSRCVTVFSGVRQHVPVSTVRQLIGVIRETDADCLVSFGGGSPIDMAKSALIAALAAMRDPGTERDPVIRTLLLARSSRRHKGHHDDTTMTTGTTNQSTSELVRRVRRVFPSCRRGVSL
jgi:alcohol dehydrogenase class IV